MSVAQERRFQLIQQRRYAAFPYETDTTEITSFGFTQHVYRQLDTIFLNVEKREEDAHTILQQYPEALVEQVISLQQKVYPGTDRAADIALYRDTLSKLIQRYRVEKADVDTIYRHHIDAVSAHQRVAVRKDIYRGIIAMFGMEANWHVEFPTHIKQSLLALLMQRSVLPNTAIAKVLMTDPTYIPGLLQRISVFQDEVDTLIPEPYREQDPHADESFPILCNDYLNIIDAKGKACRYKLHDRRHRAVRALTYQLADSDKKKTKLTDLEKDLCLSIIQAMLRGSEYTLSDVDPLRIIHRQGHDAQYASNGTGIPLTLMKTIWRGLDCLQQ